MYFDTCTFRNDEIEFLRAGEIADARVSNVCRLVSRNDVVPYTHRCFSSARCSMESLIFYFFFLIEVVIITILPLNSGLFCSFAASSSHSSLLCYCGSAMR